MSLYLQWQIAKAEATEPQITKVEATEPQNTKVEAAGIRVETSTKNRVLADLMISLEALGVSIAKPLAEQATLEDLAAIAVLTSAADAVATTDTSSMWFGANAHDDIHPVEGTVFGIGTVLLDASTLDDATAFQVAHTRNDSVTVTDSFIWGYNHALTALDAVTTDDFSSIDNHIDKPGHSVTTVVDTNYWATLKTISDGSVTTDAIQLTASKLFSDSAFAFDTVDVSVERVLTETTGISDDISVRFASDLIPVLNGATFNSIAFG